MIAGPGAFKTTGTFGKCDVKPSIAFQPGFLKLGGRVLFWAFCNWGK